MIADHLETFLASLDADPDATGLPAYVQREFYDYVPCGILAHGFLRLGCDTCHHEVLLAFSGKRRGFCPSCAGRRMVQTAEHLVAQVIPWVPTRQWVVSVPIPLRDWMASSQALTATVQTIIRTTIGQYYVNQAVTRGVPRDKVQPGSVTFIQRFGSAINLHVHYHGVFLEGVSLDRTAQGRMPRFLPGEPPTDTAIADVVQTISRRVIRTLRQLGYLEAGLDAAGATGYDPLVDDAPELARTKVLIADDEADLVDVLRDRLEAYGCTVLTAGTGREALAKLATEPVDGIFLDVKMPDLDGLAALDEIRRRDPQTPIIIVTASSNHHAAADALARGANAYVLKPFAWDELKATIAQLYHITLER